MGAEVYISVRPSRSGACFVACLETDECEVLHGSESLGMTPAASLRNLGRRLAVLELVANTKAAVLEAGGER